MAEDWDAVAARPDRLPAGWRRHARAAHLELLGRWVGEPAGRWLKTDLQEEARAHRALLGAGWVGIDVAPAVCAAARARHGAVAAVADVRRLPFPPGGFDGVLSTSTLDHFTRPGDLVRALGELRRVLAPGGRLVLTLDNPANPLVRLRNALPRPVQRATGLVPFEVGATLGARAGAGALERAGFEVVAVEHLLHAPHVVGTRLARFAWWERRVLPAVDRVAGRRPGLARRTGHFVAFLAAAGGGR